MSPEAAQKAAASFDGQRFFPPPRSITDTLTIFDQVNETPPAKLAKYCETANLKDPSKTDTESVVLFYKKGYSARRNLGQVEGALSDARKAYAYYEKLASIMKSLSLTRNGASAT